MTDRLDIWVLVALWTRGACTPAKLRNQITKHRGNEGTDWRTDNVKNALARLRKLRLVRTHRGTNACELTAAGESALFESLIDAQLMCAAVKGLPLVVIHK